MSTTAPVVTQVETLADEAEAELAAMKKERDAMNDDTYPEGVTASMHIAHDIRMGRFPEQSSIATFLAEREAEIRSWTPNAQFIARIRELSTPPRDDYDRAVHLLLEAYEKQEVAHQEFRLQNDREWRAKLDAAKARASQAEAPSTDQPRGVKVPEEAIDYVLRYGGRCRDCADNLSALCPTRGGLPCDVDEARTIIAHTVKAINYGLQHGFLPALQEAPPATVQPRTALSAASRPSPVMVAVPRADVEYVTIIANRNEASQEGDRLAVLLSALSPSPHGAVPSYPPTEQNDVTAEAASVSEAKPVAEEWAHTECNGQLCYYHGCQRLKNCVLHPRKD